MQMYNIKLQGSIWLGLASSKYHIQIVLICHELFVDLDFYLDTYCQKLDT